MKLLNVIAPVLAVAAAGMGYAQQAQPQPQGLKTYLQFDKGNIGIYDVVSANGSSFQFIRGGQPMQADAKKCKVFFIQTPVELANGSHQLSARDYAAARKSLASCKSKYMPFATLPGNPSLQAAVMEIQCAVKQQDWAALGGMVSSFPVKSLDKENDYGTLIMVNAAKTLAKLADVNGKAAEIAAEAEKLLGNNKVKKQADGSVYGWLKYALGRAQAAQVPEAEVNNGEISDANAAMASKAVDSLCEAIVSCHGAEPELILDAMKRAQALLWAMPGVQEYASRYFKADRDSWNGAPQNLKDAAALAFQIKNIYQPDLKDAKIDKAALLFFNSMEGTGAAAKEEAPAE